MSPKSIFNRLSSDAKGVSSSRLIINFFKTFKREFSFLRERVPSVINCLSILSISATVSESSTIADLFPLLLSFLPLF